MTRRAVLGTAAAGAPPGAPGPSKKPGKMSIGFHTGAFNSAYWSFEQCLQWGRRNQVPYIECGSIDGVVWSHGLGYYPHVALWEDPEALRRKMDKYGVHLSQIDAAFPLSRPEGASLGIEYVLRTIRWAKLAGCPRVDTTDDRFPPEGMTDREGMEHLRRIYARIVPAAESYGVVVNIEPHGHFTTRPDFMAEMLAFSDSPSLRMNMDTGNTFIAGQDPVAFLERFKDRVDHVHVKDVAPKLAASARGKMTGIGMSHCAIGEGVNRDNIRRCLEILDRQGYEGVLSMECESQGGPLIERSLEWLRAAVAEINRKRS